MQNISSKSVNLTILAGLVLLCSGAGYVGELPKLSKSFFDKTPSTNKLSKMSASSQKLKKLQNNTPNKPYSSKPTSIIFGEYKNVGSFLKPPITNQGISKSSKPLALPPDELQKNKQLADKPDVTKELVDNGKPISVIIGSIPDLDKYLQYQDKLATLDKPPQSTMLNKQNYHFDDAPVEKELLEMAPKDFPEVYLGSMVGYGKYARYLGDLQGISPYMISIRTLAESGPDAGNIQMFSAKANMYNLFVDKMQRKYKNKPESQFESFENIVKLREVLKDTQEYWFNHEKYKKFFHGNLTDKESAKIILDEKFEKILDLISLTLDTIRDNSLN